MVTNKILINYTFSKTDKLSIRNILLDKPTFRLLPKLLTIKKLSPPKICIMQIFGDESESFVLPPQIHPYLAISGLIKYG
jgi:hypothetical protein